MAPLLLVPGARHVVPLTDLDPVDAAPLTDAALTPYHAIKRSLDRLVPGSTALVIGAGGLGHMAIQILDAMTPAQIIAVDQSPDALRLATDVGAAHGVLTGDTAADGDPRAHQGPRHRPGARLRRRGRHDRSSRWPSPGRCRT